MNVAMMQPGFIPWQGLFELIYQADCFIFLDDFQYSVQSWDQRNRLFINKNQVGWYTVPVEKDSFKAPLNKAQINQQIPWREKMWARIENNYGKTKFFKEFSPDIKQWLLTPQNVLAAQNITFICMICDILGINKTEFKMSSQCSSPARRSNRVLELLRWCKADSYLCANGSFAYMLEDGLFPVEDIKVEFQNFVPQPYLQKGSTADFFPFLSVLDALFNIGPENTLELIKNGTYKWLTWDEMKIQSEIPSTNS